MQDAEGFSGGGGERTGVGVFGKSFPGGVVPRGFGAGFG